MAETAFTSREFGTGNGITATALVTGFGGNIAEFEQAARDLEAAGSDVIAYQYDNGVFLAGEAEVLPNLVDNLTTDFTDRTHEYPNRRYAGNCLGAGIAWNMQKRDPAALPGIYAAAGADAARLIMRDPLYRMIVKTIHRVDPRKEFERNGYTEQDLRERWEQLQTPPDSSFAIVLGGLDYAIRYRQAVRTFRKHQPDSGIHIISKPHHGHSGVKKWFISHIPQMLAQADSTVDYADLVGALSGAYGSMPIDIDTRPMPHAAPMRSK